MTIRFAMVVPLAMAVACDLSTEVDPVATPEPRDAFRWLPGLRPAAVSESATTRAATAMNAVASPQEACLSGGTDVLSIVADVMSTPGEETVLASIPHGVVVLDRSDQVLATSRPFACGGSGDEMVSLAAGDIGTGRPVIVVVATLGGRAEASTRLAVLEVGERRLYRAFTGLLAQRDGDTVQAGAVSISERTLTYEEPGATTTTWAYAPTAHAFVLIAR